MRRLVFLATSAAIAIVASLGPGIAAPGSPTKDAGEESQNAALAAAWFAEQRFAPNAGVNNNAFAAIRDAALSLPTTPGTWTERTAPTGTGVDFSDPSEYIDPASSNSGSGDRWVAGRVTALASAPDGLFLGAADGGVWKSTDSGAHWIPLTDSQGTLSIGALLVVPGTGTHYTLYAGTGEANTSSDSYAGIGVIKSTDGGASWSQVGTELNGALIFRMAQSGNSILAATSHGLYRLATPTSTSWTAVLQPAGPPAGGNFNLAVGNMITDVVVRPGSNQVLAVAGWRAGAATNGLYLSTNGGSTFSAVNPQGWVPAKAEGRTTLAYSKLGDRAYAIVQSPYLFNFGTNGKTLLQGVYESADGNPAGPWTKIATSEKLQASGSAQAISLIGKGYGPGIQAWYNQFLAVDPSNKDHLYLGLEEVYETQNAGSGWNTIAPYWNFGFSCFSYSPFEGTCNHNGAHPDQHAALIVNGKLYVGNDGGVYSRTLANHNVGDWTNNNQHLDLLQYYSAAGSGDSIIYGGLQDNGTNKVFNPSDTVLDDNGHSILVSSVQVFGGDGGYTVVDPTDSKKVITEYVGLTAAKSINGGKTWQNIIPADPNPRFIAPIVMDRTNASHLVAGGRMVWYSDAGVGGTTAGTGASTDWQNIFDTTTASGATTSAQVTALDAITIGSTKYVAAAWCGPCNSLFTPSAPGFRSGIVMLKNSGAGWTVTSNVCTTGTSATCTDGGIPRRYISGVRIDTADPTHAYLSLSGFSRKWMIGPDDPGVGHVYETTNGGGAWADISGIPSAGGLPDVPMDDIVFVNHTVVVATDFGVFSSPDNGLHWFRYGSGLPNVVVTQLTQRPDGTLVAATHGRGVWTIAAP
jgi:hypothetical protein